MPDILGRQDVSISSKQPEVFTHNGTVSKVAEMALSKVSQLKEVSSG